MAQVKNYYAVNFNNVVHHEAEVEASFSSIQPGEVIIDFPTNGPERFGSYNFSKNIYNLRITDDSGRSLEVEEVGLDRWKVIEHDGDIKVSYTIFADKGNETFSQINEDYAIINPAATFVYIKSLSNRPVEVSFSTTYQLNWKVVNQLKPIKGRNGSYEAKDLEEFMDAPSLLGGLKTVQKTIESGNKDYDLIFSTISSVADSELENLLDEVNLVTEEQKEIFGGYPNFGYGKYNIISGISTGLGNVLEGHRNSTLYTKDADISNVDGIEIIRNISKAFFKSWNGARIRPVKLKPFDYKETKLVQEYWFTEGFAEYYSLLTLCRAKIISQDIFLQEIAYHLSDVSKSPALNYFNAVQMSERVHQTRGLSKYSDPQNVSNTILPLEKHGAIIALMLDLSLREKDLSLDGLMKLLWSKYGKIEQSFSIENLFSTLREYAGESFTEDFFEDYVYGNTPFEFEKLLESFGVSTTPVEVPYVGADIEFDENDSAVISEYTAKNTPAYQAGLEKGDVIVSLDNASFSDILQYKNVVSQYKIGKKVIVKYNRNGTEKSAELKLVVNPNVILSGMIKVGSKVAERRRLWLGEE